MWGQKLEAEKQAWTERAKKAGALRLKQLAKKRAKGKTHMLVLKSQSTKHKNSHSRKHQMPQAHKLAATHKPSVKRRSLHSQKTGTHSTRKLVAKTNPQLPKKPKGVKRKAADPLSVLLGTSKPGKSHNANSLQTAKRRRTTVAKGKAVTRVARPTKKRDRMSQLLGL